MPGEVIREQVAEAELLTTEAVQLSLPKALTELLTEQESIGVVKLAEKLDEAPGARLSTVKTVLGADWASMMVTLFKITLPELLTVPEYVIKAPGATATDGQASVTEIAGAVITVQVVVTVFVTALSEQMSLPLALNTVATEQALTGTV